MTEDSAAARRSIAAISAEIDAARPPHGNEWDLHPVMPERLHISRSATDHPVIFLEGDAASFGNYGKLPGARHVRVKDVDNGREFESLLLPAPRDALGGAKALAHIVYEMASVLAAGGDLTNEELLNSVRWVLGLLGTDPDILPPEAQLGLAGECFLLRELLQVAHAEGIGATVAVDRWVDGIRDFAAHGLSIEVKTTALNSRLHHIGSINQLEPSSDGETVWLFSIGIKIQALHDRKLPDYVDDVARWLVTPQGDADLPAQAAFFERLEARGYQPAHRQVYEVGAGLMLNVAIPAHLYRASDLDYLRLASFKDETLPSMVRSIGYDLELPDGATPTVDDRVVLLELLKAQPIGAA